MPITTGRWDTEFKVSGYAGDTADYLRDRSAITSVVAFHEVFAHVSGLRTNRLKSLVIELDSRGSEHPLSTCGLTLQLPMILAGILVFWWDNRMRWPITGISAYVLYEPDLS